MVTGEPTLRDRATRMYRRLIVLERLFQVAVARQDDVEFSKDGDDGERGIAFCEGVRELLGELVQDAKVCTLVPLPMAEWRPGDRPDDERWCPVTEVERREVMQLLSGYEALIASGDAFPRPQDVPAQSVDLAWHRLNVTRFKHEVSFVQAR